MGTGRDHPEPVAARFYRSVARLHADPDGPVLGAAFLVAHAAAGGPTADTVTTCAHVVAAGGVPRARVWVEFPQADQAAAGWAVLEPGTWRAGDAEDVAFYLLEHVPVGMEALRLRPTTGQPGWPVGSFGFPEQAPRDGHLGSAVVNDWIRSNGRIWVQLGQANDLAEGFSGAPLVDRLGLVIGMVTAHPGLNPYGRGSDIAYATPSAVLTALRPDLAASEVCPYPGLVPFESDQAAWFHGRDTLIGQLREHLATTAGVLALLGPSGSGKSSLVAAGLMPVLQRNGIAGGAAHRPLRPSDGLPALARAIRRVQVEGGLLVIDQFEELLTHTSPPAEDDVAPPPPHANRGARSDDVTAESVTAGSILEQLTATACRPGTGRVLLVMRNDFYPHLAEAGPTLLELLAEGRLVNVPSVMTRDQVLDVVTRPAQVQGWVLDAELQGRLQQAVLDPRGQNMPVARLPLLALTMRRLWEAAQAVHRATPVTSGAAPIEELDVVPVLTEAHYDAVGGLEQVLSMYCDAVLDALTEPEQHTARQVLTALVRDGDQARGIPAVRQRLTLVELAQYADTTTTGDRDRPGNKDSGTAVVRGQYGGHGDGRSCGVAFERVVDRLIDARILVSGVSDRAARNGQSRDLVELAHDAIIEHWTRLRTWLADDQEHRSWLGKINPRAQDWAASSPEDRARRDPALLLGGSQLLQAEDRQRAGRVPGIVSQYIAASARAVEAERRATRRRTRILAIITALALVAAGLAAWQWKTAVEQQTQVAANSLAVQSRAVLDSDPVAAQLYAVAAMQRAVSPATIQAAENALLSRAANFLSTQLNGHADSISSVVWSPDGRRLATASNDGTARIWDAATGASVAELTGHTEPLWSVVWAPDGTRLASASNDGTARIWDAATGASVAELTGHTDIVRSVDWAPDGTRLATASMDGTARIWDAATGATVAELTGHTGWVTSAVWSPDGTRLATASMDGTARIWDAATGATLAALTGHTDMLDSVVWSPDATRLATASADGTARIWDAATGSSVAELTGHTAWVTSVVWSPDGTRLGTSSGSTARIWDAATGASVAELTGHTDTVEPVVWSPDGTRLATSSVDGTARIWDAATGATVAELTGHTAWVTSVVWSPDGTRLATTAMDGTARIWNAIRGSAELTGHAGPVRSAVWAPDGARLATASEDGTARIWDAATGASVAELTGRTNTLASVAWSPDGTRLATASTAKDGPAGIRDATTGAMLIELNGDTSFVYSVDWSPDGTRLATSSGDTARIWDATTGNSVAELTGDTGLVGTVDWSPDGTRLATSSGGTARIWDAATGAFLAELTGHTDTVVLVVWSPDGTRLATASFDGTARIWDAATGATLAELTGHTDTVESVDWAPDGTRLATASFDGTARIWDAATGATLAELTGHTDTVRSVDWAPDGTRLATASMDGTARIWDATTGGLSAELTGHTAWVWSVSWSPDGARLATASQDTTVRIRPRPSFWPEQLCLRAGRNLEQDEWGALLADTPYRRQCAQFPSGAGAPPSAPADPLPILR